jgi:hypothetical protein
MRPKASRPGRPSPPLVPPLLPQPPRQQEQPQAQPPRPPQSRSGDGRVAQALLQLPVQRRVDERGVAALVGVQRAQRAAVVHRQPQLALGLELTPAPHRLGLRWAGRGGAGRGGSHCEGSCVFLRGSVAVTRQASQIMVGRQCVAVVGS